MKMGIVVTLLQDEGLGIERTRIKVGLSIIETYASIIAFIIDIGTSHNWPS